MRFSKVSLGTGPRLHFAEQGDPGGRPLVFLHGWPDSWFSFSSVAALLPTKYRALLLDQRGFGDSDRPDDGYGIHEFAADVVAFLDALSIDRATVVGHSFGSFVARRVAIDYPERVDRLVLIGTGWRGSNPVVREVFASLQGLSDPVPQAFAREFQAGTAYAPLSESFFNRIVAESVKLPARLWREVLGAVVAYDDVAQVTRISAPTCLMWGDRDALFPREDQDRLIAAIPRIEPRIYEAIGHCPNWECPEAVADDLLAFVSRSH